MAGMNMSREELYSIRYLFELVEQLSKSNQQYIAGLIDGMALMKDSATQQVVNTEQETEEH